MQISYADDGAGGFGGLRSRAVKLFTAIKQLVSSLPFIQPPSISKYIIVTTSSCLTDLFERAVKG